MSGWIKLEKDRRDDPRVLRMARELRHAGVTHERFTAAMHVTLVLGCLDVLWCYADTHIRNGDTLDIGADDVDELVGLKGFCGLMPVDWLVVLDANRVQLPDFHAHNGTEPKRKALNQKRQERHRNAPVTSPSRSTVTDALPDQDQTRPRPDHEKNAISRERSTATHLPEGFGLTPERRAVAEQERVEPERTFANFCDYWRAASGAKARKRDWDAAWRVWCRNQDTRRGSNGTHRNGAKPSAVEQVRVATAEWARQRGVDPNSI